MRTRRQAKKKTSHRSPRKKSRPAPARGAARRGKKGRAGKKTGALKKLQPELSDALERVLGRRRRHLDALPRSPQMKLLDVEIDGYVYVLSRVRRLARDNMTRRQKQIAVLVSQGLSNKTIGERLKISPATVAAHLRAIFAKLRVKSRTALAKHALAYYS